MERRGPTTLSGSWTRTNAIGTVSPVLPRRQKMACDLLKEIYLTSNNLRGLVPADLALLSTLHHLDMDEGALSGTLPTTFGLMTDLDYLDFSSHRVSGTIPTECGALTKLSTRFSLGANRLLTGTLPEWFGLCTGMK